MSHVKEIPGRPTVAIYTLVALVWFVPDLRIERRITD